MVEYLYEVDDVSAIRRHNHVPPTTRSDGGAGGIGVARGFCFRTSHDKPVKSLRLSWEFQNPGAKRSVWSGRPRRGGGRGSADGTKSAVERRILKFIK